MEIIQEYQNNGSLHAESHDATVLLRYRKLLEAYRNHRREASVTDDDERYKWELIAECEGKSLIDIADRIKSTNLVYTAYANGTITWLIQNRRDEFDAALQNLADDRKDLSERVKDYSAVMKTLCTGGNMKTYKANDERTASAILACYAPQRYTFYKADVYERLCKYLGVEKKKRNSKERLAHFLQLLAPLVGLIETDAELQNLLGTSLEGLVQSPLLLAQDVCWCLFVAYPDLLPYQNKGKIELVRFKHLIEYFVAHLEYIQNGYSETSVGYQEYIKTWVDKGEFKSSGQGWNNQKIQNQIAEWDTYQRGKICINVYGSNYQNRGTYLNWKGTGANIMAEWDKNHVTGLQLVDYDPDEGSWHPLNISYSVNELGLFDGKSANKNLTELYSRYNEMKEAIDKNNHDRTMKEYIDLLKANRNLILTGAPGTGKTYLAKEIAKAMGAEVGFVQFHPSYDYTDFVEGLRPTKPDANGNIGFERRDGVFKAFCKKAFSEMRWSRIFDGRAEKALAIFKETCDGRQILTHKKGKPFTVQIRGGKITASPDSGKLYPVSDEDILLYLKDGSYDEKHQTYVPSIGKYILDHLVLRAEYYLDYSKTLVFIIDEINRGEISKIFGELFFSIDPGYRGEKGRVSTQYQNMIADNDEFKSGFFVPENVYILGTMNDIDRSVESMDFAMRRRFVWKEVTAAKSFDAIIAGKAAFADVEELIRNRMTNLNAAIVGQYKHQNGKQISGLGTAYQIGAAYFAKYSLYHDFEQLWDYHLKGLLYEYLRGNVNADEQLEMLKEAYNDEQSHE